MASSATKRGRNTSASSVPSPSLKYRTNKCPKFDDSDSDSTEETMENIKDAVQKAMEDSMSSVLLSPGKSQDGGKKEKGGKAKRQVTSGETLSSAQPQKFPPADPTTLPIDIIVREIVQGLTPVLTTAISSAINAAMQTVVDTVVKQTTQQVEKSMEDKLLQHRLLCRYEIDRLEQYTRRESIRIAGLEEKDVETDAGLRAQIVQMAADMGVNLESSDISVCHRLGKKQTDHGRPKYRPVICKFISRNHKSAVISNKKKLKDKEGYKHIYINEDLTPLRSRLLAIARKDAKVKNAVTKDGKVLCYMKSQDQRSPVVLDTPDDLFRLGYDDLNLRELGLEGPDMGNQIAFK